MAFAHSLDGRGCESSDGNVDVDSASSLHLRRAADDALAVVNPVLLVEVTSRSTEDYDRGEKLRHYTNVPSVREVLIASHREPRLDLQDVRKDVGSRSRPRRETPSIS